MDNLKELIPFLVIVAFSILSKVFESRKKDNPKPEPKTVNPTPVQRQAQAPQQKAPVPQRPLAQQQSTGPQRTATQQKNKPATSERPTIRGATLSKEKAPPVADIPDPLRKLLDKLGNAPKASEPAPVVASVKKRLPEPKTIAAAEPIMPLQQDQEQHGDFEFNAKQVRQAIIWQALLGKPRSKAPWQFGQSLV